jgi:hypothetical protein
MEVILNFIIGVSGTIGLYLLGAFLFFIFLLFLSDGH